MASYSALLELKVFMSNNQGVNLNEAISVIKNTNSDASGFDFLMAQELFEYITPHIDIDAKQGVREFLLEYLKMARPNWLSFVPSGREKVKSVLDTDERQCLRVAGLFDSVPCNESIQWWDEVGALVRAAVDVEKMKRARAAERLSLEYEKKRLKRLGIRPDPEWVSIDDNTLGYDIKSYDLENGSIVNRLIEVKSTLSNEIHISRNEWRNALSARKRYFFHVWKMPSMTFKEFSVSDVEVDIPHNQGKGEWIDTIVKLNL